MKKDIVKAILSEDYAKANNIFGSILAEKLEKEFEVKKKELVEVNWASIGSSIGSGARSIGRSFADAHSVGFQSDPNASSATIAQGKLGFYFKAALGLSVLAGAAVMLPAALKGMKQAKRFGKLGPNLKYIQKWFPNAKPGDEILLAFESSSGSIPSHQYIKYEQIAIILSALGSKVLQHNEKQMIVNGIDQSQESFKQITAIAARAVERDGDIKKLADYQQSQQNEESINEAGKGTDWESWGKHASTVVGVGQTAIQQAQILQKDVGDYHTQKDAEDQKRREAEVKEREAEAAEKQKEREAEVKAWGEIITDTNSRYSLKNKKEAGKALSDYVKGDGKRDFIARNFLKQYTSTIKPLEIRIEKIKEYANSRNDDQLMPIKGRQSGTVGYINQAAAKVFSNYMTLTPRNENEFIDTLERNNLAAMERLLRMAKFALRNKLKPDTIESAKLLNALKVPVTPDPNNL